MKTSKNSIFTLDFPIFYTSWFCCRELKNVTAAARMVSCYLQTRKLTIKPIWESHDTDNDKFIIQYIRKVRNKFDKTISIYF
jgi:hypothetical protein